MCAGVTPHVAIGGSHVDLVRSISPVEFGHRKFTCGSVHTEEGTEFRRRHFGRRVLWHHVVDLVAAEITALPIIAILLGKS